MTQQTLNRAVLGMMLAVLAAAPFYFEDYYKELITHMMVLGIFAMSLDLLIGFTGLISFGHAAFFGLAGYLLAIITPEAEPISIWLSLPFCLGGAALAALVIGWFSVRTSGIYFIMITLAFGQMFFYYFNENLALGGSDGTYISSKPLVGWGDFQVIELADLNTMYYFVLLSLIGCYYLLRVFLAAPFGQVIQGIRANEHRTRALGFNTNRYKLVAFIVAGTMAGLAGYLEAASTGIVSPGHLHWHQSGIVMMLVILGGMGTLYGAVFGAFALELLRDSFQDMTDHWHLFQGAFVIAVVLFLPHGIAGLMHKLTGLLSGNGKDKAAPPDDEAEAEAAEEQAS